MNNKKIKTLLIISTLSLFPVPAPAKDSSYVRADVGIAIPQKLSHKSYQNKSPKESLVYGVGIGYNSNDKFRTDFVISRMHNFKFDHTLQYPGVNTTYRAKQNINSTQFLLNGYYDIANYNSLSPYVGAGFGIAYNEGKSYRDVTNNYIQKGGHNTNFTWNVGAGITYKLTPNSALDFGYKFHDLGKIKTSQNLAGAASGTTTRITSRLHAHTITLGIRYTL